MEGKQSYGVGLYGVEWSCTALEVQGKMSAEQYCKILEDGMKESFEKLEMKEKEHYFQ